jgi:PAS domain S-box-containing protein
MKTPDKNLALLAFEHAPIGLVLTEDRVIRVCNRAFARMFGYKPHELNGQSFRILYADHAEFERIRTIGFEALASTGKYSDERLMPRRDGSLFWCRVRVHTFFPEDPLKRVILSFADISEVRPVTALTLRERQVIQGLVKGLTSKEIGRELDLSPRTIEEHRANLLSKFEVNNVAGLLAKLGGIDA